MNLEDTLTRSLHDHLDTLEVPVVDVEAARRTGERRRAATTAVGLVAALAVVAGGVAFATRTPDEGRAVQPAGLPALDYGQGRGPGTTTRTGQAPPRRRHLRHRPGPRLDTRASATPWGVVWVGEDQSVRILHEDGTVELLARRIEDARPIQTNVKYDAVPPRIGWLPARG